MAGRQQVQHLVDAIAMGTLANVTAIIGNTNMDSTRNQGVRIKQFKAAFHLTGNTAGEGPIVFGLCTELTAVEVAECMNADPQGIEDTDASDKANRKVFPIGIFNSSANDNDHHELEEVKYPWKELPEGATLKWFVFNVSGAALTTGAIGTMTAAVVQEWMRD